MLGEEYWDSWTIFELFFCTLLKNVKREWIVQNVYKVLIVCSTLCYVCYMLIHLFLASTLSSR